MKNETYKTQGKHLPFFLLIFTLAFSGYAQQTSSLKSVSEVKATLSTINLRGEYTIPGTLTNDIANPSGCNPYISQLSTGDISFTATFPIAQAMVEVFARKNNQQHLATNITSSQVANTDGTFTYNYTIPASFYETGNTIQTRFYSYAPGGAGIFTPGPSEGVWSEPFIYNQTTCDGIIPPAPCNEFIQQLSNGNIQFLVRYPVEQAYVEVFATRNGQQNIATNIVGSQIENVDGSFSYSYTAPASIYSNGNQIRSRFYAFAAGSPAVFTPGPASDTWSEEFIYGVTTCVACNDIYEPNESIIESKDVPLNILFTAQINSATDVDFYKITTTNTQPYIYIVLQNLVVDYDLYFYNSDGILLQDSRIGGNSNEYITYTPPTAGSYFLKVVGYNGAFNDQCYELKVNTSGNSTTQNGSNSKLDIPSLNKRSIEVYPNPIQTENELSISMIDNTQNGKRTFRIYNMSGLLVSEQNVVMTSGYAALSMAGIKPGIYLLDGGTPIKQKIIIE